MHWQRFATFVPREVKAFGYWLMTIFWFSFSAAWILTSAAAITTVSLITLFLNPLSLTTTTSGCWSALSLLLRVACRAIRCLSIQHSIAFWYGLICFTSVAWSSVHVCPWLKQVSSGLKIVIPRSHYALLALFHTHKYELILGAGASVALFGWRCHEGDAGNWKSVLGTAASVSAIKQMRLQSNQCPPEFSSHSISIIREEILNAMARIDLINTRFEEKLKTKNARISELNQIIRSQDKELAMARVESQSTLDLVTEKIATLKQTVRSRTTSPDDSSNSQRHQAIEREGHANSLEGQIALAEANSRTSKAEPARVPQALADEARADLAVAKSGAHQTDKDQIIRDLQYQVEDLQKELEVAKSSAVDAVRLDKTIIDQLTAQVVALVERLALSEGEVMDLKLARLEAPDPHKKSSKEIRELKGQIRQMDEKLQQSEYDAWMASAEHKTEIKKMGDQIGMYIREAKFAKNELHAARKNHGMAVEELRNGFNLLQDKVIDLAESKVDEEAREEEYEELVEELENQVRDWKETVAQTKADATTKSEIDQAAIAELNEQIEVMASKMGTMESDALQSQRSQMRVEQLEAALAQVESNAPRLEEQICALGYGKYKANLTMKKMMASLKADLKAALERVKYLESSNDHLLSALEITPQSRLMNALFPVENAPTPAGPAVEAKMGSEQPSTMLQPPEESTTLLLSREESPTLQPSREESPTLQSSTEAPDADPNPPPPPVAGSPFAAWRLYAGSDDGSEGTAITSLLSID